MSAASRRLRHPRAAYPYHSPALPHFGRTRPVDCPLDVRRS
ncbi:hypothetical protein ACF090_25410 [Streptomyces sp. NPDC014892]|nr:hypothetical protein [Streptomyces deccanensis]